MLPELSWMRVFVVKRSDGLNCGLGGHFGPPFILYMVAMLKCGYFPQLLVLYLLYYKPNVMSFQKMVELCRSSQNALEPMTSPYVSMLASLCDFIL